MLYSFGQLLHNISQHDPTMLQGVCVEMLRALGRAIIGSQVWLSGRACESAQKRLSRGVPRKLIFTLHACLLD